MYTNVLPPSFFLGLLILVSFFAVLSKHKWDLFRRQDLNDDTMVYTADLLTADSSQEGFISKLLLEEADLPYILSEDYDEDDDDEEGEEEEEEGVKGSPGVTEEELADSPCHLIGSELWDSDYYSFSERDMGARGSRETAGRRGGGEGGRGALLDTGAWPKLPDVRNAYEADESCFYFIEHAG